VQAGTIEPNWTDSEAVCQGRAGRGCGAAGMAVVRLDNIGKSYGAGADVLHDVSLTLQPGDLYVVTGASGAGKTRLLNIITLAEQPSSGGLTLFGTDALAADRVARAALRRRIGIVFQDLRLLDHLSARDNIALPLRIVGVAEGEIRDHVSELADWLAVGHRVEARPEELSASEQQCIAIARAIVSRPDLLVADEPTGRVNWETAQILVRAFEQLNSLGTTVLIATQDVALARQFECRRLHLEAGELTSPDPDVTQ
jgi:cell division transport system ATP-binding protein